jgi:hypothetical protein
MDYREVVTMGEKHYQVSTNNSISVICITCVETGRLITSDRTITKIFKAWAEQVHAEALEMNVGFDAQAAQRHIRWCEFIEGNDYKSRRAIIEEAHTEALEINAAIDGMVEDRQKIADKKPDYMQETWDIVRLGKAYKEAGRDWYCWAKITALSLW